jgi:hypothetical protein
MRNFAFKVDLVAVVRVRAADEDSARKAAPQVLGAPSTADIRIVNDNLNLGLGIAAVIEDVEFNVAPDFDLVEVNGERVKRRRRSARRIGASDVDYQRTIPRADGA